MKPQVTLPIVFWLLAKSIGVVKYIKETLMTKNDMLFLMLWFYALS